jgi:hypothetical protein
VSAGSCPNSSQTTNVAAATPITAGTNTALILSARRWIGAFDPPHAASARHSSHAEGRLANSHEHQDAELAVLPHRGEQVVQAQQQVHDMIKDLLTEAASAGDVRDDIMPEELASYCLYVLGAASSLPSEAAVRRLVTVTLAGLRPHIDRPIAEVGHLVHQCKRVRDPSILSKQNV